jgi:hypothetical protein
MILSREEPQPAKPEEPSPTSPQPEEPAPQPPKPEIPPTQPGEPPIPGPEPTPGPGTDEPGLPRPNGRLVLNPSLLNTRCVLDLSGR